MAAHDVDITAELVQALVQDQHPDLADRPVSLGARGWDNQLWRLGDDLAVRLPWATETADDLLLKESAWVPRLAPLLPLAVPIPQRLGAPSPRFPRPWIITTWVPGTPADVAPITGSTGAVALAAFLTALHRPAPADAPTGRGRAGALKEVAEGATDSLTAAIGLELIPEPARIRAVWEDAAAATTWAGRPVWIHGDLHPANVLTTGGDLTGVIDFGDLCSGDPAFDLAASWILLPDLASVHRFREEYRPAADTATWRRARGWAIWRALGCLFIAEAGRRGEPGGKVTWGPPALASLRRLSSDPDD